MYNFSCSTVQGLHCRILCFVTRRIFSVGDRSGLHAGQYSTRTPLLWSHAVLTCAVCGLALFCWYKQGHPWKRRCLDGSIYCSKTCVYPSPVSNKPVHLWNVPNRCFLSISQLSQSFVATVPAILECVADTKLKMIEYLQKKMKFFSLNIWNLVLWCNSIDYKLNSIWKSLYSVFIYVLHNIPIGVCCSFHSQRRKSVKCLRSLNKIMYLSLKKHPPQKNKTQQQQKQFINY